MDETQQRQGSGAALLSDAASPAQLRLDLWNHVREQLAQIAARPSDDRGADVEAQLGKLEEVERRASRSSCPGSW